MANLGEFEQLILFSVVKLVREAYGGAIRETIEARTGRVVSSGAINTSLGRLTEKQLVTARVAESATGRAGRPRKYYAITPAGARALSDSYAAMRAMADGLMRKLNTLAEDDA
jgi:DNA-binding PadR family transcriptional regulator